MQIIPAASGAPAPAAAEHVQAMGASGLPSSGLSFERILAASVQSALGGHTPGEGRAADGAPGDGQGMMSLHILTALRRRVGAEEEEQETQPAQDADYILAGTLAPPMDTDIPQTDGMAPIDDAVAHILQGDHTQAPAAPPGDDGSALSPAPAGANANFLREMLARMPQTHSREEQAAQAASTATDGGPCPLENVNDLIDPNIQQEAQQPGTMAQLTARLRESAAQEADAQGPDGLEARPVEAVQARIETAGAQTGAGGQSAETDTEESPADRDVSGMSRPLDIGALRAQGDLQSPRPAAPAAVATTETLLDTLVEKLSLERQGDSHQMEIQLRPEHLGKVTIQLTLDGNGVQARIRTEDPGVRGLIGSQVNQLIESLEQKGVRLTAVDVTYQPPQSQDFSQNHSGREQMNQENRNRGLAAQAVPKREEARGAEAPYGPLAVDTYVSQDRDSAARLL